jgi:hypothetical protein
LLKRKAMSVIEINSKTDSKGLLRFNYKLNKSNRRVRILIMVDDNKKSTDEEALWMQSIASNPAFDFLHDTVEDVYSITDREPIDD